MAIGNNASTAALILAAGTSSRMGGGRHKLLLPLAGRPVLVHVIENVLTSRARPIIIVLGHQAKQVYAHIDDFIDDPDILLVENPDYLQGMSTSMCAGIQILMQDRQNHNKSASAIGSEKPSPNSALILLGDQPFITPAIIDTLIAAWQTTQKPIVMPLYHGKRGNPTLFSASLFPELLQVSGDEGGRSVVERHRQQIATVELGDATATYDVDTWEAYQQVVEAWHSKQDRQ